MASIQAVMAGLDLCDKVWPREMSDQARKDRAKVYEGALSDLSDEDVLGAARLAVGRCKFFPVPAELREFVRPAERQQSDSTDAAEEDYAAVMDCSTYTPDHGAWWSYEGIYRCLGAVAARAFRAAGGHEAFAVTTGAEWRHKRFLEAHKLETEAQRKRGLALDAGATPTREEAEAAMQRIAGNGDKPRGSGLVRAVSGPRW